MSRQSRKDEWFKGRRWRVCAELNGTCTEGEATVHYDHGRFTIDPPYTFQTPLGHRGRAGVAVQEVGPDGQDIPGSRQTFGEQTLRTAIETYGAETVTGLDIGQPVG